MVTAVLAEALVSVLLLMLGFLAGKYRERRRLRGRDLTEYDFYPYETTADNFAEFSPRDFRLGMHYLLRNRDSRAARQLIFIGEQNNVRELLDGMLYRERACCPWRKLPPGFPAPMQGRAARGFRTRGLRQRAARDYPSWTKSTKTAGAVKAMAVAPVVIKTIPK